MLVASLIEMLVVLERVSLSQQCNSASRMLFIHITHLFNFYLKERFETHYVQHIQSEICCYAPQE